MGFFLVLRSPLGGNAERLVVITLTNPPALAVLRDQSRGGSQRGLRKPYDTPSGSSQFSFALSRK